MENVRVFIQVGNDKQDQLFQFETRLGYVRFLNYLETRVGAGKHVVKIISPESEEMFFYDELKMFCTRDEYINLRNEMYIEQRNAHGYYMRTR